jgi:DNA helicase-4
VHGSKGLEADDPVLDLAMPAPETFPHAEERRLFYVALTRARRAVPLITHPRRMSPFVTELLKDPHVTVTGNSDAPLRSAQDVVKGGCSTFPACKHTREVQQRPTGTSSTARRRH